MKSRWSCVSKMMLKFHPELEIIKIHHQSPTYAQNVNKLVYLLFNRWRVFMSFFRFRAYAYGVSTACASLFSFPTVQAWGDPDLEKIRKSRHFKRNAQFFQKTSFLGKLNPLNTMNSFKISNDLVLASYLTFISFFRQNQKSLKFRKNWDKKILPLVAQN